VGYFQDRFESEETEMNDLPMAKPKPQIDPARAHALAALVSYAPGSIVSRVLHKADGASLTLFAFDAGQGLTEHTSGFDAFVHVLEGRAALTIGGAMVPAGAGEIVWMPAKVPHAVEAAGPFKMLLVMVRP
jgi:quercetin dioxygenase-like cupin family protein